MSTIFLNAVKQGHVTQAKLLIKTGVDIHCHDAFSRPPLFYALLIINDKNRATMVSWMIAIGAELTWIDKPTGHNLASVAALLNRTSELEMFLRTETVDFSVLDVNGRSVLHYAAFHRNFKAIKLLIKHFQKYHLQIDVNDINRWSPMDIACALGYINIQHVLTKYSKLRKVLTTNEKNEIIQTADKIVNIDLDLNKTLVDILKPDETCRLVKESHEKLHGRNIHPIDEKGSKKSCKGFLPRLLSIKSYQQTKSYRPKAQSHLPYSQYFPKLRSSTTSSISFGAAARITTLAVTIRRKRSNSKCINFSRK